MTHIVVPDSIEPVLGYKALLVSRASDGTLSLHSPQQSSFRWPKQSRAVAVCARYDQKEWKLVPVEQVWRPPGRYVESTTLIEPVRLGSAQWGLPPAPAGLGWSLQPRGIHTPGDADCTCGIYTVNQVGSLSGYLRDQHVAVEVALWGQVTTGTRGARGEFAYPQRIIGWTAPDQDVEQIAEEYGIEVVTSEKTQGVIKGIESETLQVQLLAAMAQFQPGAGTMPATAAAGDQSSFSAGAAAASITATALVAGGGAVALANTTSTAVGIGWWLLCVLAWLIVCFKAHKPKGATP